MQVTLPLAYLSFTHVLIIFLNPILHFSFYLEFFLKIQNTNSEFTKCIRPSFFFYFLFYRFFFQKKLGSEDEIKIKFIRTIFQLN